MYAFAIFLYVLYMVCFSQFTFATFALFIAIIVIVQCAIFMFILSNNHHVRNDEREKIQYTTQTDAIAVIPKEQTNVEYVDSIKKYDYAKLFDPLEEPTKRADRYLYGGSLSPEFRASRIFNNPVRGYPDNPRWIGLLINETSDEQPNKILKLFGRQKYPGSSHYEYYATINMGFDQIKVHIDRKQELYDDDEVTIPEINKTFKVKLNKTDEIIYYPHY